jgi:hypothetical protein
VILRIERRGKSGFVCLVVRSIAIVCRLVYVLSERVS